MKKKLVSFGIVFFILSCNLPLSAINANEAPIHENVQEQDTETSSEETQDNASNTAEQQRNGNESTVTVSQNPYPSQENLPATLPPSATDVNIPLYVYNDSDLARSNAPVTSGLPFSQAMGISDIDSLLLVDSSGDPIPAQFTPLARWGSSLETENAPLRWIWIDFQTSLEAQTGAYYFLQEGGPGPAPNAPVSISETDGEILIETGAEPFTIDKNNGNLGAPYLAQALSGSASDSNLDEYQTGGPLELSVNLDGPMRASIQVKGSYQNEAGDSLIDYTTRYWFYAGLPLVRIFHTVENNTPCPLMEYEQIECFDIGSAGSVDIHDIKLRLQVASDGENQFSVTGDSEAAAGALTDELLLYQDSSGTDSWDAYPQKKDWDGNPLDTRPRMQSYVSWRGYQTTLGGETIDSGYHAQGLLSVFNDNSRMTVGIRDFWQNFPKALEAAPDGTVEIHLFPAQFGGEDYDFNLRAGEHKTHEIWLSSTSDIPFAPAPLFAQALPEGYVSSGAFGLTALRDDSEWPEHEQYLADQLDTSVHHSDNWDVYENLFDAVEKTDFYGIFDYGDLPIDYEGFGVSPLNPKYDFDYGMWLQWARGSDTRWFGLAEAVDRHTADIDLLHTLHTPRHWSDGNIFGHSYHDEDGFTNPHRNYGGLTPDTAYGMDGMLLLYYLTGYEKAYESAMELADYVEYRLHNDDYLCSYYAGGECNGAGYVLFDGLYNAGARPAANSLSMAVAAYRATADPRFWEVASALVEWADPQSQPYIDGPTGGHSEEDHMRPWMLNMYLRALGSYIRTMDEYGLDDPGDAKADYLVYADWLHSYAWIQLEPIDSGARAAYPYQWWFDERQGDITDEWAVGNNIPSINNWLFLGADAMAYAYHISGDRQYLDWAAELFRTGSRDEFFEGDESLYTETKQTVNALIYGNVFLYEWARKE